MSTRSESLSSTVVPTPLARSSRPTMFPNRPKPAMMTGVLLVDPVGLARRALRGPDPGPDHPLEEQHEQRARGHREGHHRDQGIGHRRGRSSPSCRRRRRGARTPNSPTWGSEKAKSSPWSVPMRNSRARRTEDRELDREDADHQPGDRARPGRQQAEVDRGADRDEEEAQQEPLERLDVALQLVAVLAVGQDDAGEEGAQRGAEAHAGHEEGDADDQEQRRGGEELPQAGAGPPPGARAGPGSGRPG